MKKTKKKTMCSTLSIKLDAKHWDLWQTLKKKFNYRSNIAFIAFLLELADKRINENCLAPGPEIFPQGIPCDVPVQQIREGSSKEHVPVSTQRNKTRKCVVTGPSQRSRSKKIIFDGSLSSEKIKEAGLVTTISLNATKADETKECMIAPDLSEPSNCQSKGDSSTYLDLFDSDSNLPHEELNLKVSEMVDARFDDDELDDVLDMEPSGSLLRAFSGKICEPKDSDLALERVDMEINDEKDASLLDLSQNDLEQSQNTNLYESSLILSQMSPTEDNVPTKSPRKPHFSALILKHEAEKENFVDTDDHSERCVDTLKVIDKVDAGCEYVDENVPYGFYLRRVGSNGAAPSVFSSTQLETGEIIGPLLGLLMEEKGIQCESDLSHLWQVGTEEKPQYLTTLPAECSNWLRHIHPAACQEKANCETAPIDGRLYFRTTRAISSGEQLVYWSNDVSSKWSKKRLDRTHCGGCNLQFGHVLYYRLHCTIFHDPSCSLNIRKYYCKICGAPFLGKDKIMKHASSEHDGKGAYQCNYCEKFFLKLRHLDMHRVHSCPKNPNKSKVKCDMCEREFCQPGKLKIHKRRMHSSTEGALKEFQCSLCDKVLVTVAGLLRHKKEVHQKDDLSSACETCGKVFQNKSNLKIHLLTHSGLKPFRCGVEECTAGFTTKQRLQAHYTNTHGLQPEKMPKIQRSIEFTFDAYSGGRLVVSPEPLQHSEEEQSEGHDQSEGMSPLSVGCSVDLPPLSVPRPDAYSEDEECPDQREEPVAEIENRKWGPLHRVDYSSSLLVEEAICDVEKDIISKDVMEGVLPYDSLPTYIESPPRDYSVPSPSMDRPPLYSMAPTSPNDVHRGMLLSRNYSPPPFRDADNQLPGSPMLEQRTNQFIRDYNISSLIRDETESGRGLIDPGKDPEVAEYRAAHREESRDGLAEYRRDVYRREGYMTTSESEAQNLSMKEKPLHLDLTYKGYEGLEELGRDTAGLENLLLGDAGTQVVGRTLHLSPRYPPTYDTESMDLSLPRMPYSASPIYSLDLPSRFDLPTGRLVDLRSHLGLSPHRFSSARGAGNSPPPSYMYQSAFGSQHPSAARHSPTPAYHPYTAYY